MTQIDFYQTLGVRRDAGSSDIRAAFVRLTKLHHPDMAGSLPWRLQEVQQAYRCLSDPAARAAHDRSLAASTHDHFVRQAAVQRRLRRYDRRHPHGAPRPYRRWRWRSVGMVTAGIVIVAQVSLRLFG